MKIASFSRPVALALLGGGLALVPAARAQFLGAPNDAGWYVRAGGGVRFNIKADIRSIPLPSGTGIYDDGYVLPDNGGTASGLTWNWGYNNDGQIVSDQLVLNRLTGVPVIGQQDLGLDNQQFGGEIIAGFRLTSFDIGKKPARLNFEAGYGYLSFSQSMGFGGSGNATLTTDRYNLNGITPPLAPYAGTAAGPGPLISLNSAGQTVIMSPASSTFAGNLDATFHELRFGVALEVELTPKLTLGVGVGYSAIYTGLDLAYTETVTFTNPLMPAVPDANVNLHRAEWHPGAYIEARLHYKITKHLSVFVAGDLHSNGDGRVGDATHEVKIDLGSTYGAKVGVSVGF